MKVESDVGGELLANDEGCGVADGEVAEGVAEW